MLCLFVRLLYQANAPSAVSATAAPTTPPTIPPTGTEVPADDPAALEEVVDAGTVTYD
jgi:hypothetical protein